MKFADSWKDVHVEGQALWYAIHTRYQHEKLVRARLSEKGFETFLPLYTALRRWSDRIKPIELPLFSCYVFLRSTLQRHYEVICTPGVYGVVGTRGKAAVIPVAEIESLMQVAGCGAPAKPHAFLNAGDRVRIKSGPLKDIEGILIRTAGQTRLVISIELVHQAVAVEIESADVARTPCFATRPLIKECPIHVLPYTTSRIAMTAGN